ncbi:MAG: hypothetical protein WAW02_00120 [Sideroxyarcus sp.]
MKPRPNTNVANSLRVLFPADSDISAKPPIRIAPTHSLKQRGVVLFLTLLALLVMSLAAVALIRSVDTSTLISGNLAFKQAATAGGDARIEDGINWLTATQYANGSKNIYADADHALNLDFPALGYYSFIDPNKSLTDVNAASHFKWDNTDSSPEYEDSTGNKKRYIIQRACRLDVTVVQNNDCLFDGSATDDNGQKGVQKSSDVCNGPGCPTTPGLTPVYRITVQTIGLKNSISYVQAFAY